MIPYHARAMNNKPERIAGMNEVFAKFNWRLARYYFPYPNLACEGTLDIAPIDSIDFRVFLPQDRSLDVLTVRDWLHDPDNNVAGYRMFGCFEMAGKYPRLTGIVFLFGKALDAIYFRLYWTGTIGHR